MERLDQIRDLDDLVFGEYKDYFPKILDSEFSRKYPKTIYLSNLFTSSTTFIKNSIFDCAEKDDLFGAKILFRSLIEHFLRFKYVFFYWMNNQDDSVSEKYIEFTEAREKLDQIKATISEYKLSNPDIEVKSWKRILEEIPSLSKYSKKQIENETLKYSYKNIIKVLKEADNTLGGESTFYNSLILEYANLSSFVHGGAGAYKEMMKMTDSSIRIKELIRISELSYLLSGSVKLYSTLMLFQTDKEEFGKHYIRIDELLKI